MKIKDWYLGKRIRPKNEHLVFHFVATIVSLIFLLPMGLYFALLLNAYGLYFYMHIIISRVILIFMFSVLIFLLVCFLYLKYGREHLHQMFHRQKLAHMVLENGWYEKGKPKESFFKDIPVSKEESIAWFPKMYYKKSGRTIIIVVKLTLGRYQDQYKTLEKRLESGFDCELILKEVKSGRVTYELVEELMKDRIEIKDVTVQNSTMQLMRSLSWNFDKQPHMLIAGGTGSGKSYFILALIEALIKAGAVLNICDPKNADLADLEKVLPHVYHTKEDIVACVEEFHQEMLDRMEDIKALPNYQTGKNYAYYGLAPHFLVFDEYVAFSNMIDKDRALREPFNNKLVQILMLGRQAGYFVILACQRPDAKYLGDGMRDQFNFRVALGRMSELGYSMMYGDVDKNFYLKDIKGRGYIDFGESVIIEFYSPFVPDNHDFMREIEKAYQERGV